MKPEGLFYITGSCRFIRRYFFPLQDTAAAHNAQPSKPNPAYIPHSSPADMFFHVPLSSLHIPSLRPSIDNLNIGNTFSISTNDSGIHAVFSSLS